MVLNKFDSLLKLPDIIIRNNIWKLHLSCLSVHCTLLLVDISGGLRLHDQNIGIRHRGVLLSFTNAVGLGG